MTAQPLDFAAVVDAWRDAGARPDRQAAIHPTGAVDPDTYVASGAHLAQLILEKLPPDEYPIIGDFGCGDGRVARWLEPHYDRIICADGAPEMLDALPNLPGLSPCLSTGVDGELPQIDGWYTCAVTIHHDHAGGAAILDALATATRPGGRILFDQPVYDEPRTRAGWTDVTVWTARQLHDTADRSGLTVTEGWHNEGAFSFDRIGPNHGRFHVLDKP